VNFLLRILEKSRKDLFEKGKPLHILEPAFDAADTFLFSPIHTTSSGPHVRDAVDNKRFMSMVILALVPTLIFGIYNAGYQSQLAQAGPVSLGDCFLSGLVQVLPLIVISYAVGGAWEALFSVVRRHPINEGFLVTGLLFPLVLPPTLPWWQAAIGVSFGVVIGKEVFGGTGMNILNPALLARAFCFFTYPGRMSGDNVWVSLPSNESMIVHGYSGATPLATAAATPAYESVVNSLAQARYGLSDLFFGFVPGSIGETSTLACLLGALFLVIVGVGNYRTIIGCFLGGAAVSTLLWLLAPESLSGIYHLPPHYHLVAGGFAFGAVFMATDPVSSTGTRLGKWLYGICIGGLAILIRTINPAYPEGMMLAILFMNIFAPFIDYWVLKTQMNARRKHHE
jgi:Na+-transporting NADH:ubiquinone oxidoreductase subunit B